MVALLLAHKADPAAADTTGKAPIVYAAARGFAPIVRRLLEAGVGVNARYGSGLTALIWAAGHANDVPEPDGLAVVSLLLERGAALEAVDDRGRTALMTAAERDRLAVVDLLLRQGADPAVRDNEGRRAVDLAASEAISARLRSP